MIILDTHRVDRLGMYGYSKSTSPNLDDFAKASSLYKQAVSPGQWTIPAHASFFSGEYPTTHRTVQGDDALPASLKTAAEHLQTQGYHTLGLCNNPLVGVLNNGLRRGFDEFYNFGGAIPTPPRRDTEKALFSLAKVSSVFRDVLRRVSEPIQQAVASSDKVFHFILNPLLVPLWSRYANFKGNTAASIQEAIHFMDIQSRQKDRAPYFLFLNLMGTHLPYTPPRPFTEKFAPVVREERHAQDFIQAYNTQAIRWLLPMEEPFSPIESAALSGMYDAEVAYQDHLLGPLLDRLSGPGGKNTLVVILGDHGEMLGEHLIMGHGLGLYEELVHVPLIMRIPEQNRGQVIEHPVSTTRLFHTLLDAGGVRPNLTSDTEETAPAARFGSALTGMPEAAPPPVFSEGYPPVNVIKIMEKITPHLLETFHSHATNWAVYQGQQKLIRVADVSDEVFNLANDPGEQQPLAAPALESELQTHLDEFLVWAIARRPDSNGKQQVIVEDEKLLERLRGLGYIE